MSRLALIAMLVLLTGQLRAQNFRARVLDIITKEPVTGATVKGNSSALTDANGNFSLTNAKIGDTIRIIHLGYKPYIFTFNALHPGLGSGPPPEISLQPNSIMLNEIFVKSYRRSKADSIKNRQEFASEFTYTKTSFKDIFVVKSPEELMARHIDVHRGNNTYSASSLVKLDVLNVVGYLAKNKTRPSKLQKTLLQDEGDKYIDRVFSKETIISITKLTGDSLKNFMIRYRPTLKLARSNTEYEMIDYIRQKHLEFIK
ncbi:MAG: hypothetical protein V4721_08675 [Bacteroidota bacterium]